MSVSETQSGPDIPSPDFGQFVGQVAGHLRDAPLWHGHGADSAEDEAYWLVAQQAGLDPSIAAIDPGTPVSREIANRIWALVRRRVDDRIPMAYLLNQAWFAGTAYYVDERVLVPRSPIAELIANQFAPWLSSGTPARILEIGTGSGCIALSCALAFSEAEVVATDVSEDALQVAGINVARLNLQERVELLQSDLYEAVSGRFDLIVSNPPYVPSEELVTVPEEYLHEPVLGLDGGVHGVDLARSIVANATRFLNPGGSLVLEVGHIWPNLEKAFPRVPFTWIELERGGEGVAIVSAADLVAAGY
jgi:ribosomal protein L3 glutamine methyltransferase